MELFELQAAIAGNPAEYVAKLLKGFKPYFKYEAWKHYDVIFHDVMDVRKRPNKTIKKPTGEKLPDGTDILVDALVQVNRIGLPFQKFIVEMLATFLTGGKVDFKCTPAEGTTEVNMLAALKKVWDDNKLQFKNGLLAEAMMSQTECAELWFTDMKIDPKTKKPVPVLKMNVLRPSDGFDLQPFYDEIGDLIAFGVRYKKDKVEHYDLYTSEELRRHVKTNGMWQLATLPAVEGEEAQPAIIPLKYGKMPIIYYNQEKSEWYDVQPAIERIEKMQSNHADTNDYSGSPILFVTGDIQGFAAKGEPGKVLQGKGDAKAEYLLPNTAPESMKQEFDNLKAFIHLFSGAPDLSLNSLKGLGQIPSGAAFERMLILTYMKVRRRQVGDWGMSIQRRNNFLISALANIQPTLAEASDLNVTMDWGLYQLNDLMDAINAAITANGGKPVISQEESVSMAGLTDDPEETYNKIQAEQTALGNVFDNPPTPVN